MRRSSLDDLVPVYDFAEHHSTRLNATPAAALAAVKEVTPGEMPWVRRLLLLRGIRSPRDRPLAVQLVELGFEPIVDTEDELVLGYVGQPWKLRGGSRRRLGSSSEWASFDEPGYAKAALSFRVSGGALLETETRVRLTDAAARRRFRLYWLLIRPWSGLLRRSWLRAARRRAAPGHER
jgi:hypothetical protein